MASDDGQAPGQGDRLDHRVLLAHLIHDADLSLEAPPDVRGKSVVGVHVDHARHRIGSDRREALSHHLGGCLLWDLPDTWDAVLCERLHAVRVDLDRAALGGCRLGLGAGNVERAELCPVRGV